MADKCGGGRFICSVPITDSCIAAIGVAIHPPVSERKQRQQNSDTRMAVVRANIGSKSVNAPVPEFLYFARCIRQYSSGTCGIASSNTCAITFGRHFKMTSIWSPPLCSRVQSTFVSHLNRVFWLFYSNFIISLLVYIKSFSVRVQAQIVCAKNLSITITPYVFYWIT
jgi:hypothetical protein